MNVVRAITTTDEKGCHYEVFQNGRRVWYTFVKFGRDREHRAGGQAFVMAAREQDRQASAYAAQETPEEVEANPPERGPFGMAG